MSHLGNAVEREQAGRHHGEADEHRVPPSDANADDARRQRAEYAADGPRDKPDSDVFRPDTKTLGGVQRVPRRERLKRRLQQQCGHEDRPHAGHGAADRRPRGIRDRPKGDLGGARLRPRRFAKQEGERRGNHQDGDGRDHECRPHPEDSAQHQKHDGADAHLERDGAGGEGSVAGRHDIGYERLEGCSLQVDSGVQDNHRANQEREPESGDRWEHRHSDRREHETGENEWQPSSPSGAGAVGGRSPPWHEQKQQHVVDRHHRTNGGALLAERVTHEGRDESAEQGSGNTGE